MFDYKFNGYLKSLLCLLCLFCNKFIRAEINIFMPHDILKCRRALYKNKMRLDHHAVKLFSAKGNTCTGKLKDASLIICCIKFNIVWRRISVSLPRHNILWFCGISAGRFLTLILLTPWLMEPGGSMPHSQGLSNNTYPESNYSRLSC